jgi:uncharacterized protein
VDRASPLKVLPVALTAAIWGWCACAAAVPPPPEQSAANCATPTYASDQLVCADPALLALDQRMAPLLDAASSAASFSALHWFEPQPLWFRRRSRCAFSPRHGACLKAAYRERIDVLSALAGRASDQARPELPAICDSAPWGTVPVRLQLGDQAPLSIEDGRGTVLMVASALQPRDDWSPFVLLVIEDTEIRLEPPGGAVLRCRVFQDPQAPQVVPHGKRPP